MSLPIYVSPTEDYRSALLGIFNDFSSQLANIRDVLWPTLTNNDHINSAVIESKKSAYRQLSSLRLQIDWMHQRVQRLIGSADRDMRVYRGITILQLALDDFYASMERFVDLYRKHFCQTSVSL